jgi:hypothetical protein
MMRIVISEEIPLTSGAAKLVANGKKLKIRDDWEYYYELTPDQVSDLLVDFAGARRLGYRLNTEKPFPNTTSTLMTTDLSSGCVRSNNWHAIESWFAQNANREVYIAARKAWRNTVNATKEYCHARKRLDEVINREIK